MKKIDFGFNDDKRLNSSFSGIEFYNGEYLDTVAYDEFDLLITRIVDSHKGLNGGIDVREVAQDYYSDGSSVTYANKERNAICQKIQQLLNTERMKQKMAAGERPLDILRDQGVRVYVSELRGIEPKYESVASAVTTISPEMFKQLKDSKKMNRGRSMYDMSQEMQKLYQQIEELKGMGTHRHM